MRRPLVFILSALLSAACSRQARAPEGDQHLSRLSGSKPAPSLEAAEAQQQMPLELEAEPSAEEAAAIERTPDVVYVPTPHNVVDKMLEVAKLQKDDVLYDLGCGDGRIVIAAAKKFGIKAFGFDIDPERIEESKENAKRAGVEHLVTFERKDIFTLDLSPATVVTLYLLPELNVRLIPQLEKLAPGARIVSHDFDMEGVRHERTWAVLAEDHELPEERKHFVYLWKTPLEKEAH